MSGIESTRTVGRAGSIKNATLIAGPTASGKSRLALEIARRNGGVVVNADSMQVYDVLDVLTARPSRQDLAAAPHHLYGHVPPAAAHSTGAWLRDVQDLMDRGAFEKRPAIFVGGTGLYFKALTQGFSQMPEIPTHIRERWRYRLGEEGAPPLHRILMRLDSAVAMRLPAGDGQRIVRALEVLEASGRSILDWQAENAPPLVEVKSAQLWRVDIERDELVRRIETRFDAMIAEGALEEVRALVALQLDPALPAMRAIGVPELAAYLTGRSSFDEAVAQAKAATRQYSKRQATWFRNQLGAEWRHWRT